MMLKVGTIITARFRAKVLTAGEFHVDLYTLPDNLVQMLWQFSEEKAVF